MKRVNPFYKSKRWRSKREVILRRDSYECRECKRYGKTTQANTVHHIYTLEDYPEYRLTNDNLISLCFTCHGKMHNQFTNEITDEGLKWQQKIRLSPPLEKFKK